MPLRSSHHQPLDIVMACRAADLRIAQLTVKYLRRFLQVGIIYLFTARSNLNRFRRVLGPEVNLIDEDTALPDMTLQKLKELSLPGFPGAAGWYFQQLLKFSFCDRGVPGDYYLIWDADTIPLRPVEFFDPRGRMIFTTADENHSPYFDTYRNLLGEEPHREFSFISQHMIVQKELLWEMLARIERKFPGPESWAWKIMRNLVGDGTNLFSEYETLGHYVKNHYPERAVYRRLAWLRDGSLRVRGMPSLTDLDRLGREYDFAAFEAAERPLRRTMRKVRGWLKRTSSKK